MTITSFSEGDETEIVVIPRSVESIARDALQFLPSLRAVVVDKESRYRPEDGDFGMVGEEHKYVPVFRIDTTSPPLVSLPDTVFKTRCFVPVLMYSSEEKSIDVGGEVFMCNGGYRMGYVMSDDTPRSFNVKRIGEIKVAEWSLARNYGLVGGRLRIPYGVYKVGDKQYYGNSDITAAYIPETVKVVGDNAFHFCTKLSDVEFMPCMREINMYGFSETGIQDLEIPGSMTTTRRRAFCNSRIRALTLSEGLEIIGKHCIPVMLATEESNIQGRLAPHKHWRICLLLN